VAAKRRLAVVPQHSNLDRSLTAIENLTFHAAYFGAGRRERRRRAVELMERVGLGGREDEKVDRYSGGMAQRLMIARALMHEPQLLILDEPTAGVDIEIRRSMWSFLKGINGSGTTIILTTHYLEEAEALCRNIAIIDRGRIAERDRMSNLLRRMHTETFVLNLREAVSVAPQLDGYSATLVDDHTLEIEVSKEQNLNEIFSRLSGQRIEVVSMRNKVNRLEEIFMRLVERGERV